MLSNNPEYYQETLETILYQTIEIYDRYSGPHVVINADSVIKGSIDLGILLRGSALTNIEDKFNLDLDEKKIEDINNCKTVSDVANLIKCYCDERLEELIRTNKDTSEENTSMNNKLEEKELNITSNEHLKVEVCDVEIFGEDLWKLICKASSKSQGWMKYTKAMEIYNVEDDIVVGCLVQTTSEKRNPDGSFSLSDTITYIPNCRIKETIVDGRMIRKLVR